MSEADPAYMGYATDAELVEQLNELLAAERAGTKVAVHSRRDNPTPQTSVFLKQLAKDEAACCSMLARHIASLGGTVTSDVGNFYESAMAVTDLNLRLAFINRGQDWVARKLKEILPKVRSDAMHADLRNMLRTHEDNISATNQLLGDSALNTTA